MPQATSFRMEARACSVLQFENGCGTRAGAGRPVSTSWVKTAYDPTGDYKVVKDFGVTMFFYNNKIVTEKPTTMK